MLALQTNKRGNTKKHERNEMANAMIILQAVYSLAKED